VGTSLTVSQDLAGAGMAYRLGEAGIRLQLHNLQVERPNSED